MKYLIALLTVVVFLPTVGFAEQVEPVFNESGPDESKFFASGFWGKFKIC